MGDVTRLLLSEGLDLCIRARKLDAIQRRQDHLDFSMLPEEWVSSGMFDTFVARNNILNPHAQIETRSLTPALWALDQYERDLADWEARARQHLLSTTAEDPDHG